MHTGSWAFWNSSVWISSACPSAMYWLGGGEGGTHCWVDAALAGSSPWNRRHMNSPVSLVVIGKKTQHSLITATHWGYLLLPKFTLHEGTSPIKWPGIPKWMPCKGLGAFPQQRWWDRGFCKAATLKVAIVTGLYCRWALKPCLWVRGALVSGLRQGEGRHCRWSEPTQDFL